MGSGWMCETLSVQRWCGVWHGPLPCRCLPPASKDPPLALGRAWGCAKSTMANSAHASAMRLTGIEAGPRLKGPLGNFLR